jgi:CRP-like cAMP-binding protein
MTSSVLIRSLERYGDLQDEDRQASSHAAAMRQSHHHPRREIFAEGDPCYTVSILVAGWACTSKMTERGERQIVTILLPGDICDPHAYLLARRDMALHAITAVDLVPIRAEVCEELVNSSWRVALAYRRALAFSLAALEERLLAVGRQSASARLAALFLDILARAQRAGVGDGSGCDFPLTQQDLADACGLTSVHVNRILREMRRANLIQLKGRRLSIPGERKLRSMVAASSVVADESLVAHAHDLFWRGFHQGRP